eukprot:scaffold26237_cov27-Tisochrysis_lutea.AAC.2
MFINTSGVAVCSAVHVRMSICAFMVAAVHGVDVCLHPCGAHAAAQSEGAHSILASARVCGALPIDDEMAEAMTPPKGSMPDPDRNTVLQQIAKVAKRQGAWQLAAKKFTQAGEKIKAMKALLRSGDREKIVFFTGECVFACIWQGCAHSTVNDCLQQERLACIPHYAVVQTFDFEQGSA